MVHAAQPASESVESFSELQGSQRRSDWRLGPGLLVAAAFVGPGTVVSASKAGAAHGCQLLWTIAFASIGAIILQLFAARLGITARSGLGEHLRNSLRADPWFKPLAVLVVAAIGIGNAAYQTGNLSGAASGLASIAGGEPAWWIAGLAAATVLILLAGRYRTLQGILVSLVVLLSLCFLATATVSLPSMAELASGFVPVVNAENLTLVVALIGTTIVPYNLFLHASSAAENWTGVETKVALRQSAWDTCLSIGLGGLVTAAILVTAHSAFFQQQQSFESLQDIGVQLEPLLGRFSGVAFALGVFAAGLTSSITAPLATGFALAGILGWSVDLQSFRFRAITISVVLIGALFAIVLGRSPAQTIVFAQVANGLLLPVVALVVLVAAERQTQHRPARWLLVIGWCVVALVMALAAWKMYILLN